MVNKSKSMDHAKKVKLCETGCRLVGKVAAENSHKWVFKEATKETDPIFISSWNTSLEPVIQSLTLHYIILYLTYVPDFNMFLFIDKQQPKAWDSHFNSGIQVAENITH